jgi:cationic peptide transport system ATP-binding protein
MSKILSVNSIEYTHSIKRGLFGTEQSFKLGPISFDMYSGETVAIMGNNGAGKSLLAKALVGAVQIDSGSIQLHHDYDFAPAGEHENGNGSETADERQSEQARDKPAEKNQEEQSEQASDMQRDKARENHREGSVAEHNEQAHEKVIHSTSKQHVPATQSRTRGQDIRLILQHNADALNPSLSIGSILTQTLTLNTDFSDSRKREKIEETLVTVGLLREHYYFYRHMLSDGQQQRVALARALLLDPKIIVADEPFAALDPSVRSQTINLILKLQNELGLGFVFISHNIGIVRHISDRVLVMEKGHIIEQGKTSEVFTDPQQPLTQKLIQSHFSMVEKHFSRL